MTIGPEEERIIVNKPGAAKLLAKRNVYAATTNSKPECPREWKMNTLTGSADTLLGDNYVYYALSQYMSKSYGR